MKIILFATGSVGLSVTQHMRTSGDIPAILVLDSESKDRYNPGIVALSGVEEDCIIYSSDLYNEDTLERLRSLDLDMGLLAWWPHIIKKEIISLTKRGIINLHPSYLPYNRGKDPNFWALLNGTPFGATIHYVNEEIDSGDIIAQKIIPINWEDTGESLYYKSVQTLLEMFKDIYPRLLSGDFSTTAQDKTKGSIHYRRELEAASEIKLEDKYTARDLLNIIRARVFKPHPYAWFVEDGKKYDVRIDIKLNKEKF